MPKILSLNEKLMKMREEHGYLPDQDLYDFAKNVLNECLRIFADGTISHQLTPAQRTVAWELIRNHFGMNQ
jgi:hypothetical protein